MKKKYLILVILWFAVIPCFAQIYTTGNGNGFSYDCYTQADNPFVNIYKTGNGGDKIINCSVWGPDVTLPGNLLTFDALCTNNNVALLWSTTSQISNNYFTIERSTDKIHFVPLGNVQALQNSNQIRHYSFTDNNVVPGKLYYRLKQTKSNGQFDYSHLASANCKKDFTETISVYPNPTKGQVNITNNEIITSLVVKNLSGQPVFYRKINAAKTTINIEQLPQGTYYLEVHTNRSTTYHMLVLNKN